MRKAIVTFVQKTEADKEGPKELWYSEIDGCFVRNSLSYEKEEARRFHDKLIENGGVVEKYEVLEKTEIKDRR